MRSLLLLLIFSLTIWAQVLKEGDTLKDVTLTDQFDRLHHVRADGVWLIGWDKETTALINRFVQYHKGLELHVIVDASQIPSGILSLFVKPRLQSYRHTILLSLDERYNRALPYKQGCVTYLKLERGVVKTIAFIDKAQSLEARF